MTSPRNIPYSQYLASIGFTFDLGGLLKHLSSCLGGLLKHLYDGGLFFYLQGGLWRFHQGGWTFEWLPPRLGRTLGRPPLGIWELHHHACYPPTLRRTFLPWTPFTSSIGRTFEGLATCLEDGLLSFQLHGGLLGDHQVGRSLKTPPSSCLGRVLNDFLIGRSLKTSPWWTFEWYVHGGLLSGMFQGSLWRLQEGGLFFALDLLWGPLTTYQSPRADFEHLSFHRSEFLGLATWADFWRLLRTLSWADFEEITMIMHG